MKSFQPNGCRELKLRWCLSQTAGIIFVSRTTCATADLVTTSEQISFIPRVDDLNLFQRKTNKEMMKNRACFFLSGTLRFENKMRWCLCFVFLLCLLQTFPSSVLFPPPGDTPLGIPSLHPAPTAWVSPLRHATAHCPPDTGLRPPQGSRL